MSFEQSDVPVRAVALVGTTASGKSALGLEVARATGLVEIVSVDAMAVYREMDIGTAKPTLGARMDVPHHMIDICDPAEECTVSLFQEQARRAMAEIRERNRVPLLVGGTGLYHRAVLDDLEIPGQFPEVRAVLQERGSTPEGLRELYDELGQVDPLGASRIEPSNERRIIRALEVSLGASRPFSSFGPGLEHYGHTAIVQVGLRVDPIDVDAVIEERFNSWMAAGFLDEVRALSVRDAGLSRTARQAIGYAELLAHLDGDLTLDEATSRSVARTRSLARRQRAWFRRDPRVVWFDDRDEARRFAMRTIEGAVEHHAVRD